MFVTLVRTAFLYIFAILALRLMGKRQIGDMQPGELVITILISELAAMPIEDPSQPVATGLCAIFLLVVLEIFSATLELKWQGFHRLVNGRAAILIRDGKIDQKLLRQMRITLEDLDEVLRQQGIFDIGTVFFAVLETNGSLSVLLKPGASPATAADVGVVPETSGMRTVVISDGKLCKQRLADLGLTREQVERHLQKQHLTVGQVFLMTSDETGDFAVVPKEEL